jgi:hypothetical protein
VKTSGDPEAIALGAYMFGLIDKANPAGSGKTNRQIKKTAYALVRRDPAIIGEFRISCDAPDFNHMPICQSSGVLYRLQRAVFSLF